MQPMYLIDDRGMLESLDSGALKRRLGTSVSGGELADYAARNLGFIAVGITGQAARMWLRPKLAHPKAIATSIMWMERQEATRHCLTIFESTWRDHVIGSLPSAIQRLVDITLTETPRKSDFRRARRPLNSLSSISPLGCLLRQWHSCRAAHGIEPLIPVLTGVIDDRYILIDAGAREVVVQSFGRGIDMVNRSWKPQMSGTRLRDMYDYEYGIWAAQGYHEADPLSEPLLEDCDVIVNFPGRPNARITYRRLILPVRSPDGSKLLLGTSTLDSSINLRI
jgi:hypothetical protein